MAMLRTANGIDRSRPYSENVGNCFAKLQRRAKIAKGIMAIFKSSVLKLLLMVMGLRRGLKAPSTSGFCCLSARPRPARTHFSPSGPSHFITQQVNVSRLAFRQHPSSHRAPSVSSKLGSHTYQGLSVSSPAFTQLAHSSIEITNSKPEGSGSRLTESKATILSNSPLKRCGFGGLEF